jgi:ATP-dependent phosphofructokinase / diphosphate-dependent phosphofructokinase
MSKRIGTIGLLTGGGDAPGLNAVIRAVVKTAINRFQMRVVGIEDGYEGLLEPVSTCELGLKDVRGLLPRGGTILGTTNRGRFKLKSEEDRGAPAGESVEKAIANLKQLGIEALIVIGGDGTHTIAYEFHKRGFPIVGVPKTIDNDIDCTELTFGFDTAVDIATDALDRLHTTAESHGRVLILEVMGRNAGWIAVYTGIAGGADCVLIPEIPFLIEKVAKKIRERDEQGRQFSIIVVAEGAYPAGGTALYQPKGQLGGISYKVAEQIESLTGKDTRAVVLGHIQRGGQPTNVDRLLASGFGSAAVHLLQEGKFGMMVAVRNGKLDSINIADAIAKRKTVPPDGFILRVGRDLGISFGGEED